jgi:maltooligosyltrehalose trehalohydrolase
VEIVFESKTSARAVALESEGNGYFSVMAADVRPGMLYRFRLDGESPLYPDPVSRFQPDGPQGPSEIIDSRSFHWSDKNWRGVKLEGQVIYELHLGIFTTAGTFATAEEQLQELASLGVTVIELMPVSDFPGRFGWGYDGVNLFAPCRLYGRPDDFRHFVDRAHALGIGVILDVVYNHFGPDGNYLGAFSDHYVTKRHENEWGDAINFDDSDSGPVREFFISNARYWIDEFHLDGLRLDATHSIVDNSERHILEEIVKNSREAAGKRSIIIVAENESQRAELMAPFDRGGCEIDALWNDDFHHSAMVALTGRREAYYTDYNGVPQEFLSALKWGFLYQGQRYSWQKKRRGAPSLDLSPAHFINFIQNHDQIANSGTGLRCHFLTSPGRYRAMTAMLLLAPPTPMLFQGQEFASTSPFFYFADHEPELADKVAKGRREFLSQFPSLAQPESQQMIPDPASEDTFRRCILDFSERELHKPVYRMHRDLLQLRREDSVLRLQRHRGLDGAVLGPQALVLRFFAEDGLDRLLVVNLGEDIDLAIAAEPLLAPPRRCRWSIRWSSEDAKYGGNGTPPFDKEGRWRILGEASVLYGPESIVEKAGDGNVPSDPK